MKASNHTEHCHLTKCSNHTKDHELFCHCTCNGLHSSHSEGGEDTRRQLVARGAYFKSVGGDWRARFIQTFDRGSYWRFEDGNVGPVLTFIEAELEAVAERTKRDTLWSVNNLFADYENYEDLSVAEIRAMLSRLADREN